MKSKENQRVTIIKLVWIEDGSFIIIMVKEKDFVFIFFRGKGLVRSFGFLSSVHHHKILGFLGTWNSVSSSHQGFHRWFHSGCSGLGLFLSSWEFFGFGSIRRFTKIAFIHSTFHKYAGVHIYYIYRKENEGSSIFIKFIIYHQEFWKIGKEDWKVLLKWIHPSLEIQNVEAATARLESRVYSHSNSYNWY